MLPILALAGLLPLIGTAAPPSHPPVLKSWTCSRQVRALCAWNGHVLAATGGGVLEADRSGRLVRKWTTGSGLPENDVLGLAASSDGVVATFRRSQGSWDGRAWGPVRGKSQTPNPKSQSGEACGGERLRVADGAVWSRTGSDGWVRLCAAPAEPVIGWAGAGGRTALATCAAVYLLRGTSLRRLPIDGLPGAVHLGGIAADGKRLLAAVYGSGVWALDPAPADPVFRRVAAGCFSDARCVLAAPPGLWVGTTDGLYRWDGRRAQKVAVGDEVPGPTAAALASYQGRTWLACQDGSLAAFDGTRWTGAADTARAHVLQLAAGAGRLWARHPDGSLSTFDGQTWTPVRPRDEDRLTWSSGVWSSGPDLWAGTWAGAVRFRPGSAGVERDEIVTAAPLEGEPVTAAARHGEELWLGTQRRGLAAQGRDGCWIRFDEGSGLRDSWITALVSDGPRLWVGTFNGGLACRAAGAWSYPDPLPSASGRKITSLAVDRRGRLWAGTRGGLACFADGRCRTWTQSTGLAGDEVQCLSAGDDGVWVGTRSGVTRVAW